MKIHIHGVSGIVGANVVQSAKVEGATVTGTASGKNREYVVDLGADEFIDYQTENFEKRARDMDLVLDYVLIGGASNNTDRLWVFFKPNGAIVTVADTSHTAKAPSGFKGLFLRLTPLRAVLR